MMTQVCSARNTLGVWPNGMVARILALSGMLLATNAALLAQGAPARLARGIEEFESRKYSDAIQDLKAVQPQLPKLADYVAYYLAASRVELQDFSDVFKDLAPLHDFAIPSPLAPKAALLEGKALAETGSAAAAVKLLRERYDDLPLPWADLTLAQAYEAANDP